MARWIQEAAYRTLRACIDMFVRAIANVQVHAEERKKKKERRKEGKEEGKWEGEMEGLEEDISKVKKCK